MDYSNNTKEELIDELGEIKQKYESLLSMVKSDHSEDNSSEIGRWKHAIEHTTDGLWDWDLVTNKVFFSKQWKAMLGFEEDEIGESLEEWSKRVLPEDLEGTIGKVEKHIKGETGFYESEHRLICKSGEVKWILDRGKVIDWENGIPTRMIGTHTDINQRKRKELDLIERQNELNCHNQITDIMSNPTASIDETCKKIVQFIPPAWQFPAFTFASITIYDQSFYSDKFEETPNYLEQGIIVSQNVVGRICVYCQTDGLPYHEQIFLPEEKELLISIAERIGNFFEKKLAEENLRQNEIKFRTLIETISDVIYEVDLLGNLLYVSPSAERVLGFNAEEVLGTNIFNYIYPEDHAFVKNSLASLESRKERYIEYRYLTKDGYLRWVRSATSPRYMDGVMIGGIGSLTDITDKKKSELELLKLSRAVEQSPVSIVITNLDGNIEYANPKACETTGYTLDELLNQNSRVLKSGDTPTSEYDYLWDTITHGNVWRGIFHNKRKNGELYWESSQITPIADKDGKVINYLAIKEDITERKKIQEDLARSETRFKEITAQSQTVIWEVDAEGLYTYVSSASKDVWGYEPEELTGKFHFYDLHPEEGRQEFKDAAFSGSRILISK